MAFPRKLLNPGEDITLDLQPHWWYFIEPSLTLVGLVLGGLILLSLFSGGGFLHDTVRTILVGALLAALVWFLVRFVRWRNTMFVVTTDRVIYRTGVARRRGVEIPLERVNNVNFHQSFIERLIGAGDLLIESGGSDGQQRFEDIRKPEVVQNVIHAQIGEKYNRRSGGLNPLDAPIAATTAPVPPGAAPAGPAPVDTVGQLERLEGLLQRGAITQDEYDAQKRKLLAQ
jgi:membrane protein YdbS with pleckstrin-like domain